jgi:uncharacterized membrane protein
METIIQAGNKQLAIGSIQIDTNPKLRESRLFKSNWEHIRKSALAIVRAFVMYRPHVIFGVIGITLLVLGSVPFIRFIVLSFEDGTTAGHLQSLLLGSVLLTGAFLCLVLMIIADLIHTNRILIEDQLEHTKRMRFDKLSAARAALAGTTRPTSTSLLLKHK